MFILFEGNRARGDYELPSGPEFDLANPEVELWPILKSSAMFVSPYEICWQGDWSDKAPKSETSK